MNDDIINIIRADAVTASALIILGSMRYYSMLIERLMKLLRS